MQTMQDDLRAALQTWWYQKARMGMTASELCESLLDQLAGDGFAIVPCQPNEGMAMAGQKEMERDDAHVEPAKLYVAMVDAY